jgi:hypothetical protein
MSVEVAVGCGVDVTGTRVAVEGRLVGVGSEAGVEQEVKKGTTKTQSVRNNEVCRWCIGQIVNEKGLPPTGGLSQLIVI